MFEEEAPVPSGPVPAAKPGQQAGRDPLTTATLAELYVSQGFLEKAAAVYRELVSAEPGNQGYQLRLSELREQQAALAEAARGLAPQVPAPLEQAAEPPTAGPQGDLESELNRWLENIRRRRDGV